MISPRPYFNRANFRLISTGITFFPPRSSYVAFRYMNDDHQLDVKTRVDQKAAAVAGLWSAFTRSGLPGIDEHVKQSELAQDAISSLATVPFINGRYNRGDRGPEDAIG